MNEQLKKEFKEKFVPSSLKWKDAVHCTCCPTEQEYKDILNFFLQKSTEWDERMMLIFRPYLSHQDNCILLQFEAGEPTKDGGYRQKFDGKWYNEMPNCDCGLAETLELIKNAK